MLDLRKINLTFILCCIFLHNNLVFAEVVDGRWHLGIGDPTFFGWLTVLFYLIAVVRCVQKTKESKILGGNYQFWLYLAILLLALGLNKQLDLQTWFTQLMKDSAQTHGWYEQRRPLQIAFILFLAIALVFTLLSLRVFLANSWRQNKLTWVGIVLLSTFVLMRAASFHHFDLLIDYRILGIRTNVILEIGSIFLIILGSFYENKSIALIKTADVASGIVDITEEGQNIACPSCGRRPKHEAKDGRIFKCKACGHSYMVRLIDT